MVHPPTGRRREVPPHAKRMGRAGDALVFRKKTQNIRLGVVKISDLVVKISDLVVKV